MSIPLRLNLGCGDKKIPGYIGVDLGGMKATPDVEADIRHLPWQDNEVEEILAVHVLEHFYLWEVKPLLDEWKRVLRPGGQLTLELPNFHYACKQFVKGDKDISNTLYVMYGDPDWRDPNMCHKFGWWPKSLIGYLTACGWNNPRQAPAVFKKREPRDFRVIAEK